MEQVVTKPTATDAKKEGASHGEKASELNVGGLPAALAGERVEVRLSEAAREVTERLITTEREYRVAVAQITTDPGNIPGNTEKIIQKIKEAREQGAKLVVFPELAIPGYCSMDLLFNKNYITDNINALQEVRKASEGITVIVGFVDVDHTKTRPGGRPMLYNSAAIIHDGKILSVQDKSLLPNYDIFFEQVHFARPRESSVVEAGGVKIGVEICEDLWNDGYEINPTKNLVDQGAEIIVNLSASPFHVGKLPVRSELLNRASRESNVPFIYANLVGSFDGYEGEVVFDGRSIVMSPKGTLSGIGKAFKEDLLITDVFHAHELCLPKVEAVAELHDALVLGIKDYYRRIAPRAGIKQVIIGLSGGIDSAVVAGLAVEALGADKVLGVTLPSKYSSSETRGDAELLAKNYGMRFKTLPIQAPVDAMIRELRKDPEFAALPEGVTEENIQARIRMIDLMAYANKLSGLVLNTGNKTELALDNCTIYGDMVGGFSVLGDVDKDRVFALAEYINRRAGKELISVSTIVRPPSAELKPNQLDSMVMGADPQVIAPMVRTIVEESLCVTDAVERFQDQFPKELIENTFRKLDRSEWKRRQASPGIRVTPHAFGNGRKVPMSHGYYK